jgi:hypothetical protein
MIWAILKTWHIFCALIPLFRQVREKPLGFPSRESDQYAGGCFKKLSAIHFLFHKKLL